MNPYFQKWFADKGDETHRLNYLLDENSIVFDVGGYEGTFVEKVYKKYGCKVYVFEPVLAYFHAIQARFTGNPNITVINKAIAEKVGKQVLMVNGDKSGFFETGGFGMEVDCTTIKQAMLDLGVSRIDLLKLNIEGAEYDVLTDMIKTGVVSKCVNIQVQFHTCVDDYNLRYTIIKNKLFKTHYQTYYYSFVWENWKRYDANV